MRGPVRAVRREVLARCGVTVAVVAVLASLVAPVRAAHAAAAPKGSVVLDPDDNYSHALWGGVTYTELPITYAVAQAAKPKLAALCDTSVVISRDAGQDFVPRAQRAAVMAGADVALTISLNNLTGAPWGTAADGGAQSYATANGAGSAFAARTLGEWSRFTGRPNAGGVNQGGSNGTVYPYAEFAGLPGTYAQTFFGYLDHNFDWPAISQSYDGMRYGFLVDAVVTAVGHQLQAQGITCGNAATGQSAFPAAPTQAQLAALFALGFANWMRYGADPVNFATGNFLQSASLFTVPGPGGTATPVGLTYNSLDTRSGMFGVGWSSGLTVRSQTFMDGSVLITSGDGSAVAYNRNPDGGYSPALPGIYNVLTRTGPHTLVLAAPDTSAETFTEDGYSGAGAMSARTDRAGHTWTYGYAAGTATVGGGANPWPVAPDGTSGGSAPPPVTITSLGALTLITEPGGRRIGFGSDGNGRIIRVTRPDGAAWTLAYTSGGELASITDPLDHATRYGYDSAHRMTSVTAPDGVTFITNTYDAAGRVVKQVNGDGKAATIAYRADGTTTYRDTTGAATTFTMDGSGRVTRVVTPLGHTVSTGYGNWDTTSSTDGNGNTTRYAYDGDGNLTQVSDPLGGSSSYAYTAQGDLTASTNAGGATTTYTVDGHGRTTAVAGPDGAHWRQAFDAAGNLTARTDPDGHRTAYAYDGHGNLTAVTDAAGGVSKLGYDAADRVTSVTDPLGRVTKLGYDAVGDLITRTSPSGAKTSYSYQADGQVASVTDPDGHATRYTYNTGLNLATVTDPGGGVTRFGYDSEYRRTSVTNPDGAVTRYAYDAEGLLVATTDPAGRVTRRAYDGAQNLTGITAPSGAVTKIGYDADNRPTAVTDANGGVTLFGYDAQGRLLSVTDPDHRTTSYGYDPAGRVVTVIDPAGYATSYGYDPAGNQTTATDATNRTTSFAFDALNRVISTLDPAGARTAYRYDPAGELTKVTDPVGRATTFSYTPDGQLAGQVNNAGATTSYAYDAAGQVTGVTDPRGGVVNFAYTPTGLLASTTNQDGHTSSYGYDPAGQLIAQTNPLGVRTAYRHDPAGLLTALTQNAVAGAGPGADTNVSTRYAYNPDGQLTSATDPRGHTTTYTRDVLDRITAVTNPLGARTGYGYDPAGQVTAVTDGDGHPTGYAYTPTGQLASITPTSPMGAKSSYTYDAAGRLSGMTDGTGTSTWTYNAAGLIASATDGAGKTTGYGYDAAGIRTSLTYPDGTKASYGLDPAGRIASSTDSTGTVRYGYDPSGDLTSITRPNQTSSSYRYDPTGAITQIIHTGTTTGGASPGKTGGSGPGCGNGGTAPGCPTTPGAPTAPSPTATGSAVTAPVRASPTGPLASSVTPTSPTAPAPVPATPTASPTGTTASPSTSPTPPTSPTSPTPPTSPTSRTTTQAGPGCGNGGATPGCPTAARSAADGLPMTLSYGYDADGRVTSLHQVSVTKDLSTSYGYDKLGRLTSSTRSDGANATYGYDAAGNMTAGTDTDRLTGQLLAFTASYSAADQLLTKTLAPQGATATQTGDTPAGIVATTDTYNKAGDLTAQTVATTTPGPGESGKTSTTTVTTSNTYNYAGQLLSSSRSDALNTTYSYDGLGRTTAETLPDTAASSSTSNGNGKGNGPGRTGGPGCGNGGRTPGCPATTPDTPFGGQPVHLSYDGSRPISWTTASTNLDMMWGPQGPDHQTTTGNTATAGTDTAGTSWLHLDAQGTVRAVTDSAGRTTAAQSYTDYGVAEPASGTVSTGDNGNSPNTGAAPGQVSKLAAGPALPDATGCTPLGYTSQPMNPAAGLIHFAARDYQPGDATWLSADPHSGPARLNAYQYVFADPVTLIDPDGRDPSYANCTTTACRNYMYGGDPYTNCLAQTTGGLQLLCNGLNTQPPPPAPAPNPITTFINDLASGSGDSSGTGATAPTSQTQPTQRDPARYGCVSVGPDMTQRCGEIGPGTGGPGIHCVWCDSVLSKIKTVANYVGTNVPIIGKYVEGGLLIVGGGALCISGVLELVGTGGGLTPVAGAQCAVGLGAAGYGGAVLVTAGPMQMNSDSWGGGGGEGNSSNNPSLLPSNARTTSSFDYIAQRLAQYSGVTKEIATARLHAIKAEFGFGGADNVLFDMSGNVYDPITREWLGSLTQGLTA